MRRTILEKKNFVEFPRKKIQGQIPGKILGNQSRIPSQRIYSSSDMILRINPGGILKKKQKKS